MIEGGSNQILRTRMEAGAVRCGGLELPGANKRVAARTAATKSTMSTGAYSDVPENNGGDFFVMAAVATATLGTTVVQQEDMLDSPHS
jgi:hypothetical protein